MKFILCFIILFSLVPTASAFGGIFSVLDETAYNGSLDIVTEYMKPDTTMQSSQHIIGWIDIIGFNGTVRIDGVDYGDGSDPIVLYDVRHTYLGWNNAVDYIKVTDERIITVDNLTTTEIDIHLRWYHSTLQTITIHGLFGSRTIKRIKKIYYNEYATLTKTVSSPKPYPVLGVTPAKITVFNNSFNPHIEIFVPIQSGIYKTEYQYGIDNITRINKAGVASTGAVSLSECLYWDDESDRLAYRGDVAVIKNITESEFNPADLKITVHIPYETKIITEYNISTVEYDPGTQIKESGVILPLIMLGLFGWGIKKCIKIWSDMI